VGGGGYKERVYRKINVVNILCTHASKWKKTCLNYSTNGGREDKGEW
jgi:hypothetical protein